MTTEGEVIMATLGPFIVPNQSRRLSQKSRDAILRMTGVEVTIYKGTAHEVLLTLWGPAAKLENAMRLAQAELNVLLVPKAQERGKNFGRQPCPTQVPQVSAPVHPASASSPPRPLPAEWEPPLEEQHLWQKCWNGAKCHPPHRYVWHRKPPSETTEACAPVKVEEACPSTTSLPLMHLPEDPALDEEEVTRTKASAPSVWLGDSVNMSFELAD